MSGIDLDAIQSLAKLAREDTFRPGWPYQGSGEWTENVIGMLGGHTGDFAGALSPDVVDALIARIRAAESDRDTWETLAKQKVDRIVAVREIAYDLDSNVDTQRIARRIHAALNGVQP